MKENKKILDHDLEKANKDIEILAVTLKDEKKSMEAVKREASKIKSQFQKTRGERNTYKQKADSLAKEMSRICRNGRGIADIEKLIHNHQALNVEAAQLRSDKKKALEEVEDCRAEHEQFVQAQIQAGADGEAVRTVQRNMELQGIITGMTEYLDAKEMQLESVQDANRALTEELRLMADRCRTQNDI
jgi:seryl-tRNA synthetase